MNTRSDVNAARVLVRLRDDFQSMRKRMDNRIGRKASGESQDIDEREIRVEDLVTFTGYADDAKKKEIEIEKALKEVLGRFPVYTDCLVNIKGVGTIASGWIVAELDVHKADTVSKFWQFAGLNPSLVIGKKRKENKDGTFTIYKTDTMVRGDRLTSGFVSPFNKRLRTALCGVLADGFIKARAPYALEHYYPYKARLEQSFAEVEERVKGGKTRVVAWKDATKGHRDRSAKRYMIKMFLKDLHTEWRKIEGLPVRLSYQEQYLGHVHNCD